MKSLREPSKGSIPSHEVVKDLVGRVVDVPLEPTEVVGCNSTCEKAKQEEKEQSRLMNLPAARNYAVYNDKS